MAGEAEAVTWATCECCGLAEECTPGYVGSVRVRFAGRFVCGLCAEAVRDEMSRAAGPISAEEAVSRHAGFCTALRADPAERLIAAVRLLLRRSRATASGSVLARTGRRLPALAR